MSKFEEVGLFFPGDDEELDECAKNDVSPTRPSAGSLLLTEFDAIPQPIPESILPKQDVLPAGDALQVIYNKHKERHTRSPKSTFNYEESSQFKSSRACESVKHFYGPLLPDDGQGDVTDAGPLPSGDGIRPDDHSRQSSYSHSFLMKDYKYNMNHPQRGCFLIFNYENYDSKLDLPKRTGSSKDAVNLQNAAARMGFEFVRIFDDCKRDETLRWIDAMSKASHEEYDCFACAILTHGGDKDVLYAHDKKMHLKDFTQPFQAQNCNSLAGKPKLFFVQACRGEKMMTGVRRRTKSQHVVDGRATGEDTIDASGLPADLVIPSECDFLIAQSTAPEYYSWRNETNGSIFIQALCSTLHVHHDKLELLEIMTRVNHMVAYEFESSTQDEKMNKKKQIPSITTQLTGEVRFHSKRQAGKTLLSTQVTVDESYDEYGGAGDNRTFLDAAEPSYPDTCVASHHHTVRTVHRHETTVQRLQLTEQEEYFDDEQVDAIRRNIFPSTQRRHDNCPHVLEDGEFPGFASAETVLRTSDEVFEDGDTRDTGSRTRHASRSPRPPSRGSPRPPDTPTHSSSSTPRSSRPHTPTIKIHPSASFPTPTNIEHRKTSLPVSSGSRAASSVPSGGYDSRWIRPRAGTTTSRSSWSSLARQDSERRRSAPLENQRVFQGKSGWVLETDL